MVTSGPETALAPDELAIFISYRRDDTRGDARSLFEALRHRRFGRQQLFMDVDNLIPGDDFAAAIEAAIARSDVVLVLIGQRWLTAQAADGSRRLDDEEDRVRIEIDEALRQDKHVIPVLFDATMPKSVDLPEPLRKLAYREAVPIRHDSFRTDLTRLVHALRGLQDRKAKAVAVERLAGVERDSVVEYPAVEARPHRVSERRGEVSPADQAPPDLIGIRDPDQIGRYRVERHLGTGGHATVWLARDEGLDGLVAIKVLADRWSRDPEIRHRFVDEARILRRLDDERIVRVHDIAELDDGRPYFVMEFADHGSLFDRMQRRWTAGDEFTALEALEISRAIAEGLAVAHEHGVIHRDLKPSNVLFRGPGVGVSGAVASRRTRERLLLADFGIARRLDGSSGQPLRSGTPSYMPPDQAGYGPSGTDPRGDIYSAAIILYELLAQDVPNAEERKSADEGALPELRHLRPDLPLGLEAGLARGLAGDLAARWPSVAAWLEFLASIDPAVHQASPEEHDEHAEMPALVHHFCDDATRRLPAGAVRDRLTTIGDRVTGPLRTAVVWPAVTAPDWLRGAVAALDGPYSVVDVWTSPAVKGTESDDPDGFVIIATSEEDPDAQISRGLKSHGSTGEANTITILTTADTSPKAGGDDPTDRHDLEMAITESVRRLSDRSRLLRSARAMRDIESAIRSESNLPVADLERLEDGFESLTGAVPAVAQLEVLDSALSGRLRLQPGQVAELERMLAAADPGARLGASAAATQSDLIASASDGATRWRALTADSRASLATRSAAEVVAAAYESLLWHLTAERKSGSR